MNIYADEKFYKEKYLLGKQAVIDTAYAYFFREASAVIDRYTHGNIDPENITDSVKMCCCELAERIYDRDKKLTESSGVSSESVGGWSKTFRTSDEIKSDFQSTAHDVIYKWLSGTGLLYSGVKPQKRRFW